MKSPSIPVRIVAAALVLTLALVSLVAREGLARARGQEVLLAIAGADPRSILSGHYLQFRLADEIPKAQACAHVLKDPDATGRSARARQVWVALRREGATHRAVAVANTREAALKLGDVALRGEARCLVIGFVTGPLAKGEPEVSLMLDIGIDRFHADQAEAQRLERDLRGASADTAFAVVSIGRDGKARLKGLVIGARRTDLDWF